jgi:hypothetical protein
VLLYADGCEITTASINNSREFILATPWTRFEQVELKKKGPRVACFDNK